MAVLKVEGLEKSFGKTQVLRGIGFALEKGEVLPVRPAEVLVHAQDGFEVAALARVSRLTSVGTRCESSVFDTEDEAIAYARSKGIPRVDLVGEAVRTVAL